MNSFSARLKAEMFRRAYETALAPLWQFICKSLLEHKCPYLLTYFHRISQAHWFSFFFSVSHQLSVLVLNGRPPSSFGRTWVSRRIILEICESIQYMSYQQNKSIVPWRSMAETICIRLYTMNTLPPTSAEFSISNVPSCTGGSKLVIRQYFLSVH